MIICRGTNDTDRQTDNYLPHYSGISSHSKELVLNLYERINNVYVKYTLTMTKKSIHIILQDMI
jgi:hypothetical protein